MKITATFEVDNTIDPTLTDPMELIDLHVGADLDAVELLDAEWVEDVTP